ncbi:hypothetical protein PB1_13659 [Bacillus methanolicus PB1]|uniref:Uncharacterized protein n=1 Tax=Bacillus methanolicus PB1 TaxID=997296 RepID=I3DWI7_BACMT|nr:hypothetical protein PB1_13659 [Bacillus methanolicus PB1]
MIVAAVYTMKSKFVHHADCWLQTQSGSKSKNIMKKISKDGIGFSIAFLHLLRNGKINSPVHMILEMIESDILACKVYNKIAQQLLQNELLPPNGGSFFSFQKSKFLSCVSIV